MRAHDLAARAWKAMPDTLGRHLSGRVYTAPKHVRLISWLLVCNATGSLRRLGISQPPGSGKSEIVDYYASVWLLEHDHRRRRVAASYSGELIEEQGKRVRNLIEDKSDELNVRLAPDSRAAANWRTTVGGGMWTVGVGGSLTGRRASDFVIDDPHKNFAEAMSVIQQLSVWDWYKSTARTRLLPRAAMAVIQTRWAEGDLIGRLKTSDENRGDWCFVKLPAIAEQDETIDSVLGMSVVDGIQVSWADRLRAQGLVLPEWRRDEGEPLWPELEPGVPWFDIQEYTDIRHEVGEVVWTSLYQQRASAGRGWPVQTDRLAPFGCRSAAGQVHLRPPLGPRRVRGCGRLDRRLPDGNEPSDPHAVHRGDAPRPPRPRRRQGVCGCHRQGGPGTVRAGVGPGGGRTWVGGQGCRLRLHGRRVPGAPRQVHSLDWTERRCARCRCRGRSVPGTCTCAGGRQERASGSSRTGGRG